jgi:hypothetical protein
VDDEPRLHRPGLHRLLDLVERHDVVLHVRRVEAEREERGRERPRNRDAHAIERRRQRLARDDDRAVAIAHARTVRQQDVPIREVRVRVERHRADLVLALERRAVEGLDVRQNVVDLDVPGRHLAARETVEHERVVGIGAVGDGYAHKG